MSPPALKVTVAIRSYACSSKLISGTSVVKGQGNVRVGCRPMSQTTIDSGIQSLTLGAIYAAL